MFPAAARQRAPAALRRLLLDLGLEGKVALITGASMGIGAATARRLAQEGCDVILVARTLERLTSTAQRIAAETGRRVSVHAADLAQSSEVDALAARWGEVDILVNNAGAIPGGRLADLDDAVWRSAWDLKVFGYIQLIRRVYPKLQARGGGVIVNIIGAAAQIRDPSYICGVAGNAALSALTLSLGSESHRDNIRVVGVSPGPVATERLKSLDMVASSAARPFGRPATPEEIADTVAFLASPRAGYVSGAVLMVDGGLSARSQA